MADRPGGAAQLAADGVASARYQYLSGGVGQGWTTWSNGGDFVRNYVHESDSAGLVPVFTYYMLVQSAPDALAERDRLLMALGDPGLMEGYFRELEEFFRASAASSTVVLHLEPDAWGFAQQAAGDASDVRVAMEGARDVVGGGYQETLAGFARAVLDLRDRLAPNVQVAYHLSHWGSGEDPMRSNASMSHVDALAGAAGAFYRSLGAPFDLTFTDIADRDSGFYQHVYGMGDEAWWDEQDFARHVRYVDGFARATGQPVVLWQIPYGNTRMRAVDNTWNHFQDNRVEWLLDDPSGANLRAYRDAGVIALLFGRGADGATDASDANGDGATDPPAVNGNARTSLSADDDGGFFRDRARAYYRLGPLPLP